MSSRCRMLPFLLEGLLPITSCKQIASYAPIQAPHGAGVADRAFFDQSGPTDGPRDSSVKDVVDLDAGEGPPDGISNLAADMGRDGAVPEPSTPDVMLVDTQPLNDGPVSGICLKNSLLYRPSGWDTSMVICEASVGDQCTAATFCNAALGWHLCTASEYRARGALSGGWSSFGWIAGCIRDGGMPHAPEDGLCDPNCTQRTGQSAVHGWYCQQPTGMWGLTDTMVGLTTFNHCVQAGVQSDATAAYWRPSRVGLYGDGAVCCL